MYFITVIRLSEDNSGLIMLIGQIIDAIFQPIISYCSDNIDTRLGKRYPWYLFGNIILFPMMYLIFNPPDVAIGTDEDNPKPQLWYFMLMPSILLIG